MFLRNIGKDKDNNDVYKYYAINNKTDYKTTTYYTFKDYNNKIFIDSDNEYSTLAFNITKNNELLSPHAIGNFMGNSSALEGVEGGILARHVAVNTDPNAVRLANLVAQSADGSVTLDKKQFRGIAERFEYLRKSFFVGFHFLFISFCEVLPVL